MNVGNIARRLVGAAKNAVVWGVTWSGLAFGTILGLRTVGVMVPPEIGVLDALGMAIRVGIMGGITGGAFALFISLAYRGRRLSEISAVRFGVGGAIVALLIVLGFFTLGNLATGDALPALDDILSDLVMVAAFGGIAAGASMWLAQRGDTLPGASKDAPGRLMSGDPLASLGDLRHREPLRADRRG